MNVNKPLILFLVALFSVFTISFGQTVNPPSIDVPPGSEVCSAGSEDIPVSITLPPGTVIDKVDVLLLFDDTGSFASFVPTVATIFSALVVDLETALPSVEFGFGIARFEDYGGPGYGFSGEYQQGRPFILNQPVITAIDAGGTAARNLLIANALGRTAPGYGGDGPESAIAEGLWQVATGLGFDGDGNGSNFDSGPAGLVSTQINPGISGDVPAFSSNVAPTSGTLGGVGWRSGALHLVILATDIASISAFIYPDPIPSTITGAGTSFEPVTAFAASSTVPGVARFGYVSDSKTFAGNTVPGAVVPEGAGTVQATVDALNALGIRVLGMGPGAGPTNAPGPSSDESVFLSALARLTGAVDAADNPLVFSTSVSLGDLTTAIVNAITTTTTLPIDIALGSTVLPAGLTFNFTPSVVSDVAPGETASFTVTLTGDGSTIIGGFDINFLDFNSGAILGNIPTTVSCLGPGVFPYMTIWAVNDDVDGALQYYTLDVATPFLNIEGNLEGVTGSKDIEDLKIDGDATFYFVNNVGTSTIYKFPFSELDGDENTPVPVTLVGSTGLPSDPNVFSPDEISSLLIYDDVLYGLGLASKKLYSISKVDGSVTLVATLSVPGDFRSDGMTVLDGIVYLLKTNDTGGESEIWKFNNFPDEDISYVRDIQTSGKVEALTAHPDGFLYASDEERLYQISVTNSDIGYLADYTVDIEGMDFFFELEALLPVTPIRPFIPINVTEVTENSQIPNEYSLSQNYPNPFNPSTVITYALPEASFVSLNVYNILGEKVATLVEENMSAGSHSIEFDASDLTSGLYIYTIESNGYLFSRKMVLLK